MEVERANIDLVSNGNKTIGNMGKCFTLQFVANGAYLTSATWSAQHVSVFRFV